MVSFATPISFTKTQLEIVAAQTGSTVEYSNYNGSVLAVLTPGADIRFFKASFLLAAFLCGDALTDVGDNYIPTVVDTETMLDAMQAVEDFFYNDPHFGYGFGGFPVRAS